MIAFYKELGLCNLFANTYGPNHCGFRNGLAGQAQSKGIGHVGQALQRTS